VINWAGISWSGGIMKRLLILLCLLAPAWAQTSSPTESSSPPGGIGKHGCQHEWSNYLATNSLAPGTKTTVKLAYTITQNGTVADVSVIGSSGNVDVDHVAVTCASRWTYKPKMQNGVAVEAPWQTNVVLNLLVDEEGDVLWRHPLSIGEILCTKGFPSQQIRGRRLRFPVVRATVAVDGTVVDAYTSASSGSSELDEASANCVKGWHFLPAKANGVPVEETVSVTPWWAPLGVVGYKKTSARSLPSPQANACLAAIPLDVRATGLGATGLHFSVGRDGVVKNVVVTEASNRADLDRKAAECAALYKYEPAFMSDTDPVPAPAQPIRNLPVEDRKIIRVVWNRSNELARPIVGVALPCDGFLPPKVRHSRNVTALSFVIDAGRPRDIAVTSSSGNDDLDAAAKRCVGAWRYEAAMKDGKPLVLSDAAQIDWSELARR
jgi:TonB family protein